ncbi:MAG: hypothetical protein HWE14_04220 [Flavobacteriia bacterium]|nr:hypothetical protein [Flavobacteriia bacterium]
MSQEEFLMIFHGVIFGMAIVDLVSHTKDIMTKSYWEYIVWAVMLFDMGALNWYTTYYKIDALQNGYGYYVLLMLPAILYYLVVRTFTPSDGRAYKEYFLANVKPFIGLLFVFGVVSLLVDFIIDVNIEYLWERIIVSALLIPAYFIPKAWVRMIPVAVRFVIVLGWAVEHTN